MNTSAKIDLLTNMPETPDHYWNTKDYHYLVKPEEAGPYERNSADNESEELDLNYERYLS